ncbi:hypothetical protein CBR_g37115 [Chara braunii]|uniref:Ammonium transporter AmtB-like domain-containing protein n=1 Tax=Chara braunii TaxID=69332 RepID=A0A388LMB3_CHABU|nr:hypothetical protein CBR_g37115 [Chara braunii]|eukprot:GBG83401.1 hypothetical protein CBR_g37115 [Chara braunii]
MRSYFCSIDEHLKQMYSIGRSVDATFVFFSAYLVFAMQAGFAMLTAGAARAQNKSNIVMLATVVDAAVCAMFYYFFGFACAYGRPWNDFVGRDDFGGWMNLPEYAEYDDCGGHSQRGYGGEKPGHGTCSFLSFLVRIRVSGDLPLGVGTTRVAKRLQTRKTSDGGWHAGYRGQRDHPPDGRHRRLLGSARLGIPPWRFPLKERLRRLWRRIVEGEWSWTQQHSCGSGDFAPWLGWYEINPGSILGIVPRHYTAMKGIVNRAAITTTLADAASAITTFFVRRPLTGRWKMEDACGGLIAGLVAASAGCAVIEPSAGMLLSVIAALVLIVVKRLAKPIVLDDPMEALQRHGACGLVGFLFVGVLATEDHMMQMFGDDDSPNSIPGGWL